MRPIHTPRRRVSRFPVPPFPHSPLLPLSFSPPPLSRSFYLRPTLKVARDLLGKLLIRKLGRHLLIGRIVEVEAYLGSRDPASHAYRGRTPRNEVMFKEGGHLYVYFTYGMHFCCNVVTEREGIGHAVLVRAIEPLSGIDTMARNRSMTLWSLTDDKGSGTRQAADLTNGPAKLCQAMRIGRKENGVDLCTGPIWIGEEPGAKPFRIGRSSRIGIRNGMEQQWRYFLRGNPFVSRSKPKGAQSDQVITG